MSCFELCGGACNGQACAHALLKKDPSARVLFASCGVSPNPRAFGLLWKALQARDRFLATGCRDDVVELENYGNETFPRLQNDGVVLLLAKCDRMVPRAGYACVGLLDKDMRPVTMRAKVKHFFADVAEQEFEFPQYAILPKHSHHDFDMTNVAYALYADFLVATSLDPSPACVMPYCEMPPPLHQQHVSA